MSLGEGVLASERYSGLLIVMVVVCQSFASGWSSVQWLWLLAFLMVAQGRSSVFPRWDGFFCYS